jgi:glycosyltransferase involved in cell wall biosynthesis
LKVFFVNTTRQWGGGEKWHLETACAMKDKGFDVAILALPGKDMYNRSVSAGVRTIPVQVSNLSFLNPLRIIALVRLFRKELPDVLILNFSADIKTAGISAKIAGISNIIYRRGSAIPIRNTLINRFLYKKVITQVIANSIETRHTILQHNKNLVEPQKIHVIYNGINLKQFDSIPESAVYQRRGNEVIIGNVGRLVHQKGQKYLVELALLLHEKKLNFKILIAGEGPLKLSLKRMVSEAGLEDRVEFPGFINNVKGFMSAIDIFVLPSLWEGFGYVLVEAMACRKPVVAFNISSNPEIIAGDETGFLIDYPDVEAMAHKIGILIADPELRKSFGNKGRRRVEENFDIAVTERKVEQLLTGL